MFFLIGSIIFSSYLTLAFKACDRLRINIFQAIVFNYITCLVTGCLMLGSFPFSTAIINESWFPWSLLMGIVFVILFNLTGFSVQRIGVSVVSVATKLSLVIPFVFSIYLYNEPYTSLKLAGIALAVISVVLTCYPQRMAINNNPQKTSLIMLAILPVALFLSSGLLDTLIKYVEQRFLNEQNNNIYLIHCFAVAGSIGVLILFTKLIAGNTKLQLGAILAGVLIGVPNYFSIWCLVKVLKEHQQNSSAIIPINNMGIVLFSSVVAWLLFREKLSVMNWTGIFLSVIAIALMAFG